VACRCWLAYREPTWCFACRIFGGFDCVEAHSNIFLTGTGEAASIPLGLSAR
jgi:hypothetical protein